MAGVCEQMLVTCLSFSTFSGLAFHHASVAIDLTLKVVNMCGDGCVKHPHFAGWDSPNPGLPRKSHRRNCKERVRTTAVSLCDTKNISVLRW